MTLEDKEKLIQLFGTMQEGNIELAIVLGIGQGMGAGPLSRLFEKARFTISDYKGQKFKYLVVFGLALHIVAFNGDFYYISHPVQIRKIIETYVKNNEL